MKIMVTGLRGIPNVQGGVETHAENLYPLLVEMGCDVEVIVRSTHCTKGLETWRRIRLRQIWTLKTVGLESFLHTMFAVLYAGLKRPDILHIHAVGPAIMTPLARLLGLRVVVTHHGPDYDREKWGNFARWVLYTGEKLGMKWANKRIVISNVIQQMIRDKYDLDSTLIFNGVNLPEILESVATLDQFNLQKGKYILQVSRLVPEKRQIDLIKAFIASELSGWKLVITGRLERKESYTQSLLSAADGRDDIIFTGFQSGSALHELYAHAGIFVLPSSHEGLPIALLEALSFGLRVVASNIPANLEIGLPGEQYYPLGDINRLSSTIQHFSDKPINDDERIKIRNWVNERYNWKEIAKQTLSVYDQLLTKN